MPTLINNIPFVWASSDDEEFLAASGISNPAFNSEEKISHCQVKQEAEKSCKYHKYHNLLMVLIKCKACNKKKVTPKVF